MSLNEDQIAITGIAGRYPNCSNIEELRQSLLDGTDLISTHHDRWANESAATTPPMGLIKDFEYFDAIFFGMNPKDADINDPRMRKIIEVTFEAIVDAGLNPTDLRGSLTGIFFGVSQNCFDEVSTRSEIIGRSAALMANMISYSFDFKGPSYALDTTCSTGLHALTQAADAIASGRCERAIVCGAQALFDPWKIQQVSKFDEVPSEGVCKSFDLDRQGYVKSEAVVTLILQKVKESKRIYATIAASGSNVDGYKQEGTVYPSAQMQKNMLETVFTRFNINPAEVNYMEAHGIATKVGDVQEIQAIDEFFCKNRREPLLIGSVKSNLGHCETASDFVSLTKILLAIHGGIIPGNLHYKKPDPALKGIWEGRLKVVDRNIPLPSGLIAVNSYGIGGANAAAVLRPYTEKKTIVNDAVYRLVQVSGRTEKGLQHMLDKIIENRTNNEFLSLIDNVYSKRIDNHNFRGYAILSKDSKTEIGQCSAKKRPIWFAFSGGGSQWPGMAKDLMKIEVFRNTMLKCAEALRPYGIDLVDIVVNSTEESFDQVINMFISITSVSVCLVDVLSSLGIQPDVIIGHSLGEVTCAYADGLVTAEQATLLAYARGMACNTSKLLPGLMAAVGISSEECEKILPENVFVACDNTDDNVTISGGEEEVQNFCKTLTAKGIFNRTFNLSRCAFHSPLLKPAGPTMLEFAKKTLPETKLRKRWLPSSLSEDEWDSHLGKYNSAEYQCYNFLNKVHFKQLLKRVPKDAILIEVAPRNLLQAIFRRTLDKSVTILHLVQRGVDNHEFLLSSIGRYFIAGGQPDLTKYYKPTPFPVSVNTPTISNLVKWDHTTKWYIPRNNPDAVIGKKVEIDMTDQVDRLMEGHEIDGRVILPATGYFFIAWKAFSEMLGRSYLHTPVVLEEVRTIKPTFLPKDVSTILIINIMKSTGYYEISIDGETDPVSSGKISMPKNVDDEFLNYSNLSEPDKQSLKMDTDDFYNYLNLKGYNYNGIFLGIQSCDIDGRSATILWYDNWVAFMDAMVQQMIGLEESRGLCLPTKFDKITIDPQKHLQSIGPNKLLTFNYNKYIGAGKCGAIEVRKEGGAYVRRRHTDIEPVLEKYNFISNSTQTEDQKDLDPLTYAMTIVSQILIENATDHLDLKVAEAEGDHTLGVLKAVILKTSFKKTTFQQIGPVSDEIDDYFDLLITSDITKENNATMLNLVKSAKFIFSEIQDYDDDFLDLYKLETVYKHVTKTGTLALFRPRQELPEEYTVIRANNNNFNWIEDLKTAIFERKDPKARIYLVNEDYNSGIVGLFTSIRLEQNSPNLRIFLVRNGDEIEKFSMNSKFYLPQLRKDLSVNVYHQNSWGGYRIFTLEPLQKRLFDDACYLNVITGTNSGLKWVQQTPYGIPGGRKVAIYYAALNQWDISVINGKVGLNVADDNLGVEYSGVDNNGNKVLGLVRRGALATSVQPHLKLTWDMPGNWSFQEAGTVPLAYTLSHLGLFVRGQLSLADTVLIHNSTSEVSLAAIALASSINCTVYATVNLSKDKKLVKKIFPNIPESNIIVHSNIIPFHETLLKTASKQSVNLVFNCSSLELMKLSMKCVAKHSCFVEIDNKIGDRMLASHLLERDCNYYNVTVADIFEASDEVLYNISTSIDNYLKQGVVNPFKFTVFEKYEIEGAVKKLEEHVEMGKCLIKINDKVGVSLKPEKRILAIPRTYMDPQKCYIIVGGLGGLGLELAQWMVSRGATKLILNGRRPVYSGLQALRIRRWWEKGITVFTDVSDTTTLHGAEALLNYANNLAPVGGIFNSTLLLRDEVITDQTIENFVAAVAPKLFSTQNMDFLTRKLCKELDYFVVFSSIVTSYGNASQSNYGFANSGMERICESRRAEGLPALAIEFGAIGDVGILARLKTTARVVDEFDSQKITSCLDVIDQFMQQSETVVLSYVFGDDSSTSTEKRSLAESVAGLFGIKNIEMIDPSKTLSNLGMDSLLAFEIKHLLSREFDIEMSVNDIRNVSVETIKNMSNAIV